MSFEGRLMGNGEEWKLSTVSRDGVGNYGRAQWKRYGESLTWVWDFFVVYTLRLRRHGKNDGFLYGLRHPSTPVSTLRSSQSCGRVGQILRACLATTI